MSDELARLSVAIPADLHASLKSEAAARGVTLQDLVGALLFDGLASTSDTFTFGPPSSGPSSGSRGGGIWP